jgi:hypothetical protein
VGEQLAYGGVNALKPCRETLAFVRCFKKFKKSAVEVKGLFGGSHRTSTSARKQRGFTWKRELIVPFQL